MSLPPHSVTEQVSLKKGSTTAPFVSGQKSNTEETSKQKLNQRELPWKRQVQQTKVVTTDYIGEGNGTPLQYSCLETPMDGGAW